MARQFIAYRTQAIKGVADSRGTRVHLPKPLGKGQLVSHLVSGSLTKFYHVAPLKPPVRQAATSKLDVAKKDLKSKEVSMPRNLLDHMLEGFRRNQDIGSYLE